MKNNIFLCLAFIMLMISACKKEASPKPNPLDILKEIEINATAKSEMTIMYMAYRPTGLTSGVTLTPINSVFLENVQKPYNYNDPDLKIGDKIYLRVLCPSNEELKVTVKIDGKEQPAESIVEASGDVPAQLTWQFIIK